MRTVTFTTDFQIVVSRRCAFACGYCNYPNTVSPLPPSPKAIRRILSTAARLGALQITLTAGEGIESLDEMVSTARYYGFESWTEYLHALCSEVLDWKGPGVFFPRLDAGAFSIPALQRFAPVLPLARLLIHSADNEAGQTIAHRNAPHKNPATRFAAIEDLGRAKIPVVTGLTVGIGESPDSWVYAARTISAIHARFHHIHSFVLRPFEPNPGSPMANTAPTSGEEFTHAVRAVRGVLDKSILLSAEIGSRLHLAGEAIAAGANDLGSLNVGTSERLNFDLSAQISSIRKQLAERNAHLCLRPPLHGVFAAEHEFSHAIERNLTRYNQIADRLPHSDAVNQADCYEEQTAS